MNKTEEIKVYSVSRHISEDNGKTRILIICPFCKQETWAFKWSLAGSGKKCKCGAKHGSFGMTTKKGK